jgi:hypothetical protein
MALAELILKFSEARRGAVRDGRPSGKRKGLFPRHRCDTKIFRTGIQQASTFANNDAHPEPMRRRIFRLSGPLDIQDILAEECQTQFANEKTGFPWCARDKLAVD